MKSRSKTKYARMKLPYLGKKIYDEVSKRTWFINVSGYSNIPGRHRLCLHGKLLIVTYENPKELSNERSKLMWKCGSKLLVSDCKGND